MNGSPEVCPVPNCAFIHEQALELNDIFDRRKAYVERATQDQLRNNVATRKLQEAEAALSDSILRREFVEEGPASPTDELHEISLQNDWTGWNSICQFTRQQVSPESMSAKMFKSLDDREAQYEARIERHVKQCHRSGSDECRQPEIKETALQYITAATRSVGRFVLRSAHYSWRKHS